MNPELKNSLESAIHWLTEIATVKDNKAFCPHSRKMPVEFWNGALKGDYHAGQRQWRCLCPAWHTGQAVKALVLAAGILDKPELIGKAKFNAEFIMRNRIREGEDRGLIPAFEDHFDKINTSAIIESLDGLLMLGGEYQRAAIEALDWVRRKAWVAEKNHFNDVYDPFARKFILKIQAAQGRPLLDDALFVKVWQLTGDGEFRKIALATAETLLRDEAPPGNWIKYIPCSSRNGNIHPRHAYWWGFPMLDIYKITGDERFLRCFYRSVEWYKRALRRDGGFFRGTYADFNTDSFGHATSGTACAVICFLHYYEHSGDRQILPYIEKGMEYCLKMQFVNPADPNLRGAILEKVLPPDGTDRSPYYLRDLGTIFFIQAAAHYLRVLAPAAPAVMADCLAE